MIETDLAPIILFVYNRPWHTEQTIKALRNNFFADKSKLYIFSDAAKSVTEIENVEKVREYIKTINGFKQITITEREKNYGLANSIISGVTEIANKHGKIIVLEDDLVTSKYFLEYLNKALEIYKDDERVLHISSYMYPIKFNTLSETFFSWFTSSWGWATWKRAWEYFEKDGNVFYENFTKELKYKFNIGGTYNYYKMFKLQQLGKVDSWAIRWYASVFFNQGLCLHPTKSLVNNIGHDDSGVNCSTIDIFTVNVLNKPIKYFEKELFINRRIINEIKIYFRSIKKMIIYYGVLRKIKRIIKFLKVLF